LTSGFRGTQKSESLAPGSRKAVTTYPVIIFVAGKSPGALEILMVDFH